QCDAETSGERISMNCGLRIADCGLIPGILSLPAGWHLQCTQRMTPKELKERTFSFAVRVVHAVDALPKTNTAKTLGQQLLRAATSVGANYRAAARARSRADFIAKLGIVEEECDEASYWM